jgi:hypothetical protein
MLLGPVSVLAFGASNLMVRPRSSRNPGREVRGRMLEGMLALMILVMVPSRVSPEAPTPRGAAALIGVGGVAPALVTVRAVRTAAPATARRRRRPRLGDGGMPWWSPLRCAWVSRCSHQWRPRFGPQRTGSVKQGRRQQLWYLDGRDTLGRLSRPAARSRRRRPPVACACLTALGGDQGSLRSPPQAARTAGPPEGAAAPLHQSREAPHTAWPLHSPSGLEQANPPPSR